MYKCSRCSYHGEECIKPNNQFKTCPRCGGELDYITHKKGENSELIELMKDSRKYYK